MGLTFKNANDLDKMFDKFASIPDPKKTPKKPKSKENDKDKKDK